MLYRSEKRPFYIKFEYNGLAKVNVVVINSGAC
jgi:hypothetical protein